MKLCVFDIEVSAPAKPQEHQALFPFDLCDESRNPCLNLAGLLAFGLPPDIMGLGEASL